MKSEQNQEQNPKEYWFQRHIIERLDQLKEASDKQAQTFEDFKSEQTAINLKILEKLAYQKGLNKAKLVAMLLFTAVMGGGVGAKFEDFITLLLK